jgi:hypothetical protein
MDNPASGKRKAFVKSKIPSNAAFLTWARAGIAARLANDNAGLSGPAATCFFVILAGKSVIAVRRTFATADITGKPPLGSV